MSSRSRNFRRSARRARSGRKMVSYKNMYFSKRGKECYLQGIKPKNCFSIRDFERVLEKNLVEPNRNVPVCFYRDHFLLYCGCHHFSKKCRRTSFWKINKDKLLNFNWADYTGHEFSN